MGARCQLKAARAHRPIRQRGRRCLRLLLQRNVRQGHPWRRSPGIVVRSGGPIDGRVVQKLLRCGQLAVAFPGVVGLPHLLVLLAFGPNSVGLVEEWNES